MCRETQLEWHLGGTELGDTLVSLQPRSTVKDLEQAVRGPEPPNLQGGAREVADSEQAAEKQGLLSEREVSKPSEARRAPSAQASRLLPYFPKHGVTCPPPPQSLARNADLVIQSPPSPASKANSRNPLPSPTSRVTAHSVPGSTKASARNPPPAPASRTTSRNQSSEKALKTVTNPSVTAVSKATARNPSPTPAPRTAAAPRNPSPAPASRANARNSSPAPARRTSSSAQISSPSPASKPNPVVSSAAKSPLTPSSNGKTVPSLRRPASPAQVRKEPSRPLYDDNGRRIVTPDSARKTTTIGGSPSSSLDSSGELSPRSALDVNRALRMSINRSLKKEGLGQWCPEPTTFSPIKKLTPLELQAQKKERIAGYGRKGGGGPKSGRVACEGMLDSSPVKPDTRKRCHWVTPQSEPGLISYHDEVWGVPLHDDKLLFELLVLEGLQGELSRPQILSMREYFRGVFADFDPAMVAKFDEKKVAALKLDEIIRQPEAKLRGVIENSKQLLKIMDEFGSFDKYLWNFVGFKPIVNCYNIFTQIPVKSSKAEMLSKDLMKRGFRYVGPTTVYSFMQAAGMVNDHLVSCYRHGECSEISQIQPKDVNGSYMKGF